MVRTPLLSLIATGLFAVVLLGGCSSTVTSSDLRDDWNPELYSTTKSYDGYKNMTSRHRQNAWRQLADDWAFLTLQDRNLRFSRYTLP